MTRLSGDKNSAPRNFPDGVAFRTFCSDCNNRFGGFEDKAFAEFALAGKRVLQTNLSLPEIVQVDARPNRVAKAVLSYLLAANDAGYPGTFDVEVRDILLGRKHVREFSETLFYWPYLGPALCVVRDTVITEHFFKDFAVANLLKFKPFGFLISSKTSFHGAARLNDHFTQHDDDHRSLPVVRTSIDRDISWPAVPTKNGAVFMGAGPALIATPRWKAHTIVRL